MSGTWWVGKEDLDEDQIEIIQLPEDECAFVSGPPGSGKTNLLLLRANYLYLARKSNIAIVVFNRALREFIARGASLYDFPAAKIVTCRQWQRDLLLQYGCSVPAVTGDFEADRRSFLKSTSQMIEDMSLSNIFDAILLDEAQDYLPEEIEVFSLLTSRLFCAADERQKIYEGEDSLAAIKRATGKPHVLRYHYRNGLQICRVADEVSKRLHGYDPLVTTSNYNEKANPSSVDCRRCDSLADQADLILNRLGTQLIAFPDELIGILAPTRDSMNMIWNKLMGSEFGDLGFLLHGSILDAFPDDRRVIVSTFHAAKGIEFRALHLAACDELKSSFFKNNRRMTFTAITRAKSSLSFYYSNELHGYLESALHSLESNSTKPSLDEVFGRGG